MTTLKTIISLLRFVILPSLWLHSPRRIVLDNVWKLLKVLTIEKRFQLYLDIVNTSYSKYSRLEQACATVRKAINRDLKRVTVDHVTSAQKVGAAGYTTRVGGGRNMMDIEKGPLDRSQRERTVVDTLHKLCCMNPFEFFNCILNQVDLFDTMLIKVIINYLYDVPLYCRSVAAFLITKRANSWEPVRNETCSIGQNKPKAFRNIAHFTAGFLSRFPHEDFNTVLLSCVSHIIKETQLPSYPNKLSGYYNDYIYLEKLITYIGGYCKISTEELSLDQVHCFAAGPGLKFLMLADDEQFEEYHKPSALTSRKLLRNFLLEKRLFQPILLTLAKMKLEVLYDSQLECNSKILQLREVACFSDEIHLALLQLIEFVSQSEDFTLPDMMETRKIFASILPSINTILRFCDPALVWFIVRLALNVFGSEPSEHKVTKSDLDTPGLILNESIIPLITQELLPIQSPELQSFYGIFWCLDIRDIWFPEPIYLKQISLLKKDLEYVAAERKRAVAKKHDFRNWDILTCRLNNWLSKLENECALLKKHTQKTIELLKTQKDSWFKQDTKTSWNPISVFIQYMLAPRILNSQNDALFVQSLLRHVDSICEVNNFLTSIEETIRSCSIQESDYLGLFVNEMCSMMNNWIRDPKLLRQAAKDNKKCYSKLISKLNSPTSDDSQQPNQELAELVKTIGKWENRIFRVIQHGLCLTDQTTSWMSQRIVIKFLNKTHQNFPITDVAGSQILRSLPAVIQRAKEVRWDDVLVNAKALDRNLKIMQKSWLKRRATDEEDEEIKTKKLVVESSPNKEGPKNPFKTATNINSSSQTTSTAVCSLNENNSKPKPILTEQSSSENLTSKIDNNSPIVARTDATPPHKRMKLLQASENYKTEEDKLRKFALLREKLKTQQQQNRQTPEASNEFPSKQPRREKDLSVHQKENSDTLKKPDYEEDKTIKSDKQNHIDNAVRTEQVKTNIYEDDIKAVAKNSMYGQITEQPDKLENLESKLKKNIIENNSLNNIKNEVNLNKSYKKNECSENLSTEKGEFTDFNEMVISPNKAPSETEITSGAEQIQQLKQKLLEEPYNNSIDKEMSNSNNQIKDSIAKVIPQNGDSLSKKLNHEDTKTDKPEDPEVKRSGCQNVDIIDNKINNTNSYNYKRDIEQNIEKKDFKKEDIGKQDISKKRDVIKKEENKRDAVKKDEAKREELRREELKREELKREELRREELRREELRREELRREELRREELRREESRREELRREELRREELRREESRREELRREELRREELRREELRRDDFRRDDSRREESRRDECRKDDSRRDELRKMDLRKEEMKREESRRNDLRREELRKQTLRREREESRRDDFRKDEEIKRSELKKDFGRKEALPARKEKGKRLEEIYRHESEDKSRKDSSCVSMTRSRTVSARVLDSNRYSRHNSAKVVSPKQSTNSHQSLRLRRHDEPFIESPKKNSVEKQLINSHWDSGKQQSESLRPSRMIRSSGNYEKRGFQESQWHKDSMIPWNSDYVDLDYEKPINRSRPLRSIDDYVCSPPPKNPIDSYLNERPHLPPRKSLEYSSSWPRENNWYYMDNNSSQYSDLNSHSRQYYN